MAEAVGGRDRKAETAVKARIAEHEQGLPVAGAGSLDHGGDKGGADPGAAAERYGRRLGLSGTAAYWVTGQGVIAAADDRVVEIAVEGAGDTGIFIRLGPVFGNAIRDGSALLDVSDFANTRDFNALSVEINRRVEDDVLPALAAGASVDRAVSFTGGVEIAQGDGAPATLEIVPYRVAFP